jgi:hypothetical protein
MGPEEVRLLLDEGEAQGLAVPLPVALAALDYLGDGRVGTALVRAGQAVATVEGHRDTYRVWLTSLWPPKGSCTCGRRLPCPHMAAVALWLRRHGEEAISLDPDAQGNLPPAPALAQAVWDLVRGEPQALETLRPPCTPPSPPRYGAASSLGLMPGRLGMGRRVAAYVQEAVRSPQAFAPEALEALAQAVEEEAMRPSSLPPAVAAAVTQAWLQGAPSPLEDPLRRWLLAMPKATWQNGVRPALLATLWEGAHRRAAHGGPPFLPGSSQEEKAAHLLVAREEDRGGPKAVVSLCQAQEGLWPLHPAYALALMRLGDTAQAAQVAAQAYLKAPPPWQDELYGILLALARTEPLARDLLLSAWEALPTLEGALRLLGALTPEGKAVWEWPAAREAYARVVEHLERRHAYGTLAELAERLGNQEQAVRWALGEGPQAASWEVCLRLAKAPGLDPAHALALLEAAQRRATSPQERHLAQRLYRRLLRHRPALGASAPARADGAGGESP